VRKNNLLIFIITVFLMNLASSMTIPVYPYLVLSLGIEMKVYGIIGTLTSLVNIALRLPFSTLIPVIGYFKSFALGISLLALSRIFFILTAMGVYTMLMFTIGYFLSSTRFSLVMTSRSSIMARLSPKTRRGLALGSIASIGTIASSIGPFIGSFIYESTGKSFIPVFLASALISLIVLVLLTPLMLNDLKGEGKEVEDFTTSFKSILKVLRYEKLRISLIVFMIDAFSWSLTFMYASIYLAQVIGATSMDLATLSFLSSIVGVFGFTLAGYASDKFKNRKIFLFISELFGIVYFLIYILARDLEPFYIASIMMGFVMSFWGPISTAYITERGEEISKDLIPIALGVRGFLTGLARAPGGMIGGFLYDISPILLFETALTLITFSSLLILFFVKE